MWDPEDDGLFIYQRPAFTQKVPIPAAAVCDPPLLCMSINAQWMPLILGALSGLVQPSTWDTTDPTALASVLARAQDLLDAIGTAMPCASALPPDVGPGGTQQACNIAGYIATALIHDVVDRIVQEANNDNSIVNIISGLFGIIPGAGQIVGGLLKALFALNNAINGPNLADFEDALGDPTLFGKIACAIYGCISADGQVTAANFDCIVAAVGSVSYAHADVITAIAIYLGQIGADGLQQLQIPGVVATYDCSGCPGGSVTGPGWILPHDGLAGRVDVTITAETAIGQAEVTFKRPFGVVPVITVSTNEQDFLCTVDGGSTVGFLATVKSAVVVESDITCTIFWQATSEGIQ